MSEVIPLVKKEGIWRKADPVLDDKGLMIKGGMFEHQRLFWDSTAFIKLLVAGYGAGKTFIGSKRAIAMCLENAPIPYMCVSPTYDLAMTTTVPSIEELLDGRRIRFHYHTQKKLFTIRYKGRTGKIWVRSGENPKRLKGSNLCGAGIDEPFIRDREVFLQMLARVRAPGAKHREINLTGTPEDLNWGYDISEGDERENYDLEVIRASTRSNLALPSTYVETLTNAYDDKLLQAYLEGEFVNMASGRIYYGFERSRNVKEVPEMEKPPYYIGMDFNVNPMAAVIFTMKGERVHVCYEIELPNSDTEEMINHAQDKTHGKIIEAFPDPSGKARKTSAPAGRTDFTILKDSGVEVSARKKAPAIRDRRNAVNKKYKNGTITVHPRCKKYIRYREQLNHENFIKQEKAGMAHLCDAGDYAIEYKFPIKRPIIQGRYR